MVFCFVVLMGIALFVFPSLHFTLKKVSKPLKAAGFRA